MSYAPLPTADGAPPRAPPSPRTSLTARARVLLAAGMVALLGLVIFGGSTVSLHGGEGTGGVTSEVDKVPSAVAGGGSNGSTGPAAAIWQAPEPHDSLTQLVAKMEPDELALRDWIIQLHRLPPASSLDPSIPRPLSSPPPSSLPSPPSFQRGSLPKYTSLLHEAYSDNGGKCEGATWLKSYKRLHEEMRRGEREARVVEIECEEGHCGGLGDRLLPLASAFWFALVTNRAFFATWRSPIPLHAVFDSPHLDWELSSASVLVQNTTLVEGMVELDTMQARAKEIDALFGSVRWDPPGDERVGPGTSETDRAFHAPWIKWHSNPGLVHRSFSYPSLQPRIAALNLTSTNAFACLISYLLRPAPPALELIAQYTSVLALPSVFSVGIHVRTGDRSMKDREWDETQNTVKRHSQFFRCARDLASTYAAPSQRVVLALVTDSAALKASALRRFGADGLVVTDFEPQHADQNAGMADAVFGSVVEMWMLGRTDMVVASHKSGFGKLAAFMHAREKSTVTLVVDRGQAEKPPYKDCTSPHAFTTYEELSSSWSLG
ncbi:hypothetical protein JCM10207_006191 [Rhodosporidiobolus poonsookiae]